MQPEYSVHDEEGFRRVYIEDDPITIRKGDLRALLDLATQSMDFSSGFLNEEDVECLHAIARVLGVDLITVTPDNMRCKYGSGHKWEWKDWIGAGLWYCSRCRHGDSLTPGPPHSPPNTAALPGGLINVP